MPEVAPRHAIVGVRGCETRGVQVGGRRGRGGGQRTHILGVRGCETRGVQVGGRRAEGGRLEALRQHTASRCASGDFMPTSSRCCSSAAARALRVSSFVGRAVRLSGRSSTGTPPSIDSRHRPPAASYAVASPNHPLSSGRAASPSTRTRRPTSGAAAAAASIAAVAASSPAPAAAPAPPTAEEEAAAAAEKEAVAGVKAARWRSVA